MRPQINLALSANNLSQRFLSDIGRAKRYSHLTLKNFQLTNSYNLPLCNGIWNNYTLARVVANNSLFILVKKQLMPALFFCILIDFYVTIL